MIDPTGHAAVAEWLRRYGDAWERKDVPAFAALFAPAASYHWTPFAAPQRGRAEIEAVVRAAVAHQESIRFRAEVIPGGGPAAYAHWHCAFVRPGTQSTVRLDGIFRMVFDDAGLCTEFREWWHSDEDAAG
jgi:hypothetical protein